MERSNTVHSDSIRTYSSYFDVVSLSLKNFADKLGLMQNPTGRVFCIPSVYLSSLWRDIEKVVVEMVAELRGDDPV